MGNWAGLGGDVRKRWRFFGKDSCDLFNLEICLYDYNCSTKSTLSIIYFRRFCDIYAISSLEMKPRVQQ
jgi:hypothetical protein